jgi:hypothetical protein
LEAHDNAIKSLDDNRRKNEESLNKLRNEVEAEKREI